MRGLQAWRWIMAAIFALLLPHVVEAAEAGGAPSQVQRQAEQPGNNAPVWRDVRSGENRYQTTQVRGPETAVLVQTQGETWRQLRNGPITIYGGWLLLAVCVIIAAIYFRGGPIKLHEKPSGRLLERFNTLERVAHWTMGITFCVLAVTGLIILFGKHVLLPVFGYTLFAWLAILSKNVHNFVAPVFVLSLLVFIVIYVKDNLPEKGDLGWLLKAWRMFAGEHLPSGRFNAGEKVWFWLGVVALCIVVSASGAVLLFPNFEQGRELMQQANVLHAVSAILVMAFSLGHIYMGTIGVEGAYQNMRTGYTDESWAKEHHEYWYQEVKSKQGGSGGASAPTTAAAAPVKEGWKT